MLYDANKNWAFWILTSDLLTCVYILVIREQTVWTEVLQLASSRLMLNLWLCATVRAPAIPKLNPAPNAKLRWELRRTRYGIIFCLVDWVLVLLQLSLSSRSCAFSVSSSSVLFVAFATIFSTAEKTQNKPMMKRTQQIWCANYQNG